MTRADPTNVTMHIVVATNVEVYEAVREWRHSENAPHVSVIRGDACKTTEELFSEFRAEMPLPDYFGNNWNALDECLGDLDWTLTGWGNLIVVEKAMEILSSEKPSAFETLLEVLQSTSRQWQSPRSNGSFQPAQPFHVIFQVTADEYPEFVKRIGSFPMNQIDIKDLRNLPALWSKNF